MNESDTAVSTEVDDLIRIRKKQLECSSSGTWEYLSLAVDIYTLQWYKGYNRRTILDGLKKFNVSLDHIRFFQHLTSNPDFGIWVGLVKAGELSLETACRLSIKGRGKKTCHECKKELDLSEFRFTHTTNGRRNCINCENKIRRDKFNKNTLTKSLKKSKTDTDFAKALKRFETPRETTALKRVNELMAGVSGRLNVQINRIKEVLPDLNQGERKTVIDELRSIYNTIEDFVITIEKEVGINELFQEEK